MKKIRITPHRPASLGGAGERGVVKIVRCPDTIIMEAMEATLGPICKAEIDLNYKHLDLDSDFKHPGQFGCRALAPFAHQFKINGRKSELCKGPIRPHTF